MTFTRFFNITARIFCVLWLFGIVLGSSLSAWEPPSNVGPLLRILKSGKLPAERVGAVAKMVCQRGNEHDLAFVYQQAIRSDVWPIDLRKEVLTWLAEASATRKIVPAGELSGLSALISQTEHPELQRLAIQLAGEWKIQQTADLLRRLATAKDSDPELKALATSSLISLGGETAQNTIAMMLDPKQPITIRFSGLAALAKIDAQEAADKAARILQQVTLQDDPSPVLDAFLEIQGGSALLAAALEKTPPSKNTALLLLRHMYAVGRSDKELDHVLSHLAGIDAEAPKLTEQEIKELASTATKLGDPVRGEAVFRRADLACMRCHSVSKAGGQIGPDLSAVGVSSPVDYLVKSIFDPDAQKKEEYITRIIVTDEGRQITGIIEKATDDALTLKTADGKHVTIARADIDFEANGKSLMPEGLTKFMTDQEILDLVKFLSMLGRPQTEYVVRSTPRMQRWRYLKQPDPVFLKEVPNVLTFGDEILNAPDWEPVYARVNGELPLQEIASKTKQSVIYVKGEFEVTSPGLVGLRLDSAQGTVLWIDRQDYSADQEFLFDAETGRHAITLRIDLNERASETLKLELFRPSGSRAQFAVVDGP